MVALVGLTALVACADTGSATGPTATEVEDPQTAVQDVSEDTTPPSVECIHDADCSGSVPSPLCSDSRCEEGVCVVVPRENLLPCDDGDACTEGSRCESGVCTGGSAIVCEDESACTSSSCDSVIGCLHENHIDGETCDDGDPCTTGDACEGGVCSGESTTQCVCQSDEDCGIHEDDDLCNGHLRCLNEQCQLDATTVVSCDSPGPCLASACDPGTGECTSTVSEDGGPCDDGNICTDGDHCAAGLCVGVASACSCVTDLDCGAYQQEDYDYCQGPLVCMDGTCTPDANAAVTCGTPLPGSCLLETCEPTTGLCVTSFAATGTSCVDPIQCETPGTCDQGTCLALAPVCDDGDPCTQDACEPELGCQNMVVEGPCEDGDPCTVGETCGSDGLCSDGTAANCDDGDPCSQDACSSEDGGCVHTPVDDGESCETDNLCLDTGICSAGVCLEQPLMVCETSEPCTDAVCDPSIGCTVTTHPDGTVCDVGDPCAQPGVCAAGICEVLPIPCNDDNPCTIDSCDQDAGGCVHKAKQDGDLCNPDNPCLETGSCIDGLCEATEELSCDSGPCEIRACDQDTGACVLVGLADNGTPCDPQIPCGAESLCQEGVCGNPELNGCDDGDACTMDVCDVAANTCTHEAVNCLAPAGEPCVEATCVADVGCVKAQSPECAVPDDVLWSTSFDCTGETPWSFSNEGGGPEFNLQNDKAGPPDWDEDCALNIEGMVAGPDNMGGAWTASAESPPFGLPADSDGNLNISFMEWWGAEEQDAPLNRRIQVIDAQGEILAEAEITSAPSTGMNWAKEVSVLSLTASSSAIRLVIVVDGTTFGGSWFVDKLVVTLATGSLN